MVIRRSTSVGAADHAVEVGDVALEGCRWRGSILLINNLLGLARHARVQRQCRRIPCRPRSVPPGIPSLLSSAAE